jgi:hypothetical protein
MRYPDLIANQVNIVPLLENLYESKKVEDIRSGVFVYLQRNKRSTLHSNNSSRELTKPIHVEPFCKTFAFSTHLFHTILWISQISEV